MKTRIREERSPWFSTFYTERYSELYAEWVPALYCSFKTKREAEEGLEFFLKDMQRSEEYANHMQEFETVYHDYP